MPKFDLLTVGNPKTSKGTKYGYITAVLHLSPYQASGYQTCPMAELAGCWQGCLNTAGRGGIAKGKATMDANGITLPDNAIQKARIRRTHQLYKKPALFWAMLITDIHKFIDYAESENLIPCVRLNGTSDLRWESMKHEGKTIFERFPDLQFYDYTKLANRRGIPANYHLTLSYSEASEAYQNMIVKRFATGCEPLAVVGTESGARSRFPDSVIVDGDKHDLRFLDPDSCIVLLSPKGKARKDESGFVIR